ncbi:hypothetical protein SAY86_020090 [Trapa natans]|uniref:methionine S-methyltransferase n=1 Tax=Trapa natans TaxID=22666 RepID=A0AAN7LM22_TRANT|nr:hypothetical protein SAY86_020090 [Trapa natans]
MASFCSMDDFLKQCEQSGDAAYGAFRSLLERLDDPNTRAQARVFLSDLHRKFGNEEASQQCLQKFNFRIEDIVLDQCEGYLGRKTLKMMVIPSIFIPEDWSFTFYEGLNRHPDSIFKDKTVAELGCGNGWITIAIAAKWLPSKVYGLDINPRAVKISWINLYMNALDEDGQPIYDGEGKSLLDRVEFHESDLLGYCRVHNIKLERIVGCIPQILNPNPDAMSKLITENASEEFLYSLSNYCALQGFVEDQFGLGLIARAVEEGIDVIKPMGIMIFNMGGRPGHRVCRRLFERRGFRVTKLWQTKILQATDTDISALVEIEKNSPHRFEFFMGLASDKPICARTAWAYGKAGGRISHALSVYSCQLRQPNQVKRIFEFLKNGFHEVSSSLDLSFEDDSVAEEKIPFLAYFSSMLKENSTFPYEPPAGSRRFRNLISGFMRTYHHIPLNANNIVVFPSRSVAIENALRLFSPRLAIVDQQLTPNLPRNWLTSLASEAADDPSDDVVTVIEAPIQSDLLIELIKMLKPQVVITGLAQFEAVTTSAFQQILDATRDIGSHFLVDISDHFELSSLPGSNGVLKYLAGNPLPAHASILCGLVKNQVYSDLEVAFVISEEESILEALSKTVELLQGNTAPISQNYYACLFHELLSFQLADRHRSSERENLKKRSTDATGIENSAIAVLKSAELSIDWPENPSLIHMDIEKSFLPVPPPVKAAIFESFARQNIAEAESDITSSIRQLVKSNYGYPDDKSTYIISADSSLALFNKLVGCCLQDGGTLCFPAGINGNYVSAAKLLKVSMTTVPTVSADGFKLTEKSLSKSLETVKKPWVYISAPTISPTGMIYTDKDMGGILSTCSKLGAKVIIDTSFSGLEYNQGASCGWNLAACLSDLCSTTPSFGVFLLGELSLKMLSGALNLGFIIFNQSNLVDPISSFTGLSKPHGTVKYAIKKLLGMRERRIGDLMDATAEHVKILQDRSKQLKEALEKNGWDVLQPSAGISMVARPSAYLGKSVSISIIPKDGAAKEGYEQNLKIDDSNIREALYRTTGLCINSTQWTGIPGYCRLTFAMEGPVFEQALECIAKFKSIAS